MKSAVLSAPPRLFSITTALPPEDTIIGKTDEDMGWHVDNMPYYHGELDVLQKGRVIEKVPGQCIIRGVLQHHIICYKWPLYRDGKIIGLMGLFFDTDACSRKTSRMPDSRTWIP